MQNSNRKIATDNITRYGSFVVSSTEEKLDLHLFHGAKVDVEQFLLV